MPLKHLTLSRTFNLRARPRHLNRSVSIYNLGFNMKNKLVLSLLILCLVTVSGLADTPPFPMSLSKRVNSATHIFVGKAKNVTVVRYADVKTGKVEKVKPEPKVSGSASGVFFEIEVEIQEVLYPLSWKPSKIVKVHYRGGRFSIEEYRKSITENSEMV